MTIELTVPNMACSACAETITKAIQAIDSTATVTADPSTKQVIVDSQSDRSAITTAITNAGYTVA